MTRQMTSFIEQFNRKFYLKNLTKIHHKLTENSG